jgi:hypothetical protein
MTVTGWIQLLALGRSPGDFDASGRRVHGARRRGRAGPARAGAELLKRGLDRLRATDRSEEQDWEQDVRSPLAPARRAASPLICLSPTERAACCVSALLVKGVHLIVGARGARIADRARSVHAGASDTKSVCVGAPISTGSSRRQIYGEEAKGGSSTGAYAREKAAALFAGVSDASNGESVSCFRRHRRRLDLRRQIRRTSLQVRLRAAVHGEELTSRTWRWCGSHRVRRAHAVRVASGRRAQLQGAGTESTRGPHRSPGAAGMTRARVAIVASDHGYRGPAAGQSASWRAEHRRSLARRPMTQRSRPQSMPRSRFE